MLETRNYQRVDLYLLQSKCYKFEELKIDVEEDEENEILILADDDGNMSGINELDIEVEVEDVFSYRLANLFFF